MPMFLNFSSSRWETEKLLRHFESESGMIRFKNTVLVAVRRKLTLSMCLCRFFSALGTGPHVSVHGCDVCLKET